MSKGARLRAQRAVQAAVAKSEEQEIKQLADLGMKPYQIASRGPNRAARRYRPRLRYYVNADDKDGKPFTAKGVKHSGQPRSYIIEHRNETQHQRVVRTRAMRKMALGYK